MHIVRRILDGFVTSLLRALPRGEEHALPRNFRNVRLKSHPDPLTVSQAAFAGRFKAM